MSFIHHFHLCNFDGKFCVIFLHFSALFYWYYETVFSRKNGTDCHSKAFLDSSINSGEPSSINQFLKWTKILIRNCLFKCVIFRCKEAASLWRNRAISAALMWEMKTVALLGGKPQHFKVFSFNTFSNKSQLDRRSSVVFTVHHCSKKNVEVSNWLKN